MTVSSRKNIKEKPLVVKRVRWVYNYSRKGTWKIAYADFVTALMAFFLLMWLTSTLSREDLIIIGNYFKQPLSVVLAGGKTNELDTSLIPKQGNEGELYESTGQVHRGDIERKKIELRSVSDLQRLRALKEELERAIDINPVLKRFKNQLRVELTTEGLRIMIIDEYNRPMFELGSATLKPYTAVILQEIGRTLNLVPNKVALSGHTDARPYQGGEQGYSNWELSMDRANASRRELIAGGMEQDKILRVVGLASSAPLNEHDPYDAHNRRISIIVLNQQAAEEVIREGTQ